MCKKCGIKPCESKGKGNDWRPVCWKCRNPTLVANRKYRKNAVAKSKMTGEQLKCWKCGFLPEHMCQLDLDHIDGNRDNNTHENHQLLCANCHRLKTILNGDHLRAYSYTTA